MVAVSESEHAVVSGFFLHGGEFDLILRISTDKKIKGLFVKNNLCAFVVKISNTTRIRKDYGYITSGFKCEHLYFVKMLSDSGYEKVLSVSVARFKLSNKQKIKMYVGRP